MTGQPSWPTRGRALDRYSRPSLFKPPGSSSLVLGLSARSRPTVRSTESHGGGPRSSSSVRRLSSSVIGLSVIGHRSIGHRSSHSRSSVICHRTVDHRSSHSRSSISRRQPVVHRSVGDSQSSQSACRPPGLLGCILLISGLLGCILLISDLLCSDL